MKKIITGLFLIASIGASACQYHDLIKGLERDGSVKLTQFNNVKSK